MGKKAIKTALALIISASLLCCGALGLGVGSVSAVMPELTARLLLEETDAASVTAEDVAATLDGEPLQVTGVESAGGLYYIYMADVSASIPMAHFLAAREAIRARSADLRDGDALALISFGSTVKTLLTGGESAGEVDHALNSMSPVDQHTRFYEAMETMEALAADCGGRTPVAIIISDGADDADSDVTRDEMLAALTESGVAVCALCVDGADTSNAAAFEALALSTGGSFAAFSADSAADTLSALLAGAQNTLTVTMLAPTNVADGRTAELAVTVAGETATGSVELTESVPDETAPEVTSAEYDAAANTLTVTYSETVLGAESVSGYALTTGEGERVAAVSVTALGDNSYAVAFAAAPETAVLTFSVSGVTDASMELNPLAGYNASFNTGYAASEPESGFALSPVVYVAAGGALVVMLALLVILKKRRGPAKPGKEKKPGKPEKAKKEKAGGKETSPSATFIFMDKENGKK